MKLTEWTACGGCAAKWGGATLSSLLPTIAVPGDANLLLGLAPFDDAAIYVLTPDVALVSTTDFFPPLVDDPSDFGAIAAANACSDVFAMGGRVILALNVAAFPEDFPIDVAAEIMSAAAEVVSEAGGTVAGGHTIRSSEPLFGLAVQGTVHPGKVWTKGGARPGDRLVLSKPIGSGIVLSSGDDSAKRDATAVMRQLNRPAAESLLRITERAGRPVHAVTDVTGFGLAGHSWEMSERSKVGIELHSSEFPLYRGALAAAEQGVRTGGDRRNRDYLESHFTSTAPAALEALCLDPQTSGGLLAAVGPEIAGTLVDEGWWDVGEVVPGLPSVRLD